MLHMAGEHLSATFPTGLGGISRPIKFDAQAKALGPGIRRTKTQPNASALVNGMHQRLRSRGKRRWKIRAKASRASCRYLAIG